MVDSPVTTSVVSSEALATAPSANVGDVLRGVPGLNVIQVSARDVQVTSRHSAGVLANSQPVLMDGRSVYLDFFGMVLWDSLPVGTGDIEQIEVVRGPASAMWGPNAMTGAVHVITRAPRDAAGTTLTMSGGWIDRDAGSTAGHGAGTLFGANATLSRAPSDRLAYRVSAGYFQSDAFPRPTGRVPVARHRGPSWTWGAQPIRWTVPVRSAKPSSTAALLSRSSTCASTRSSRGAGSSPTRAASAPPTASCIPGWGRSTSTAARTWGTARWATPGATSGSRRSPTSSTAMRSTCFSGTRRARTGRYTSGSPAGRSTSTPVIPRPSADGTWSTTAATSAATRSTSPSRRMRPAVSSSAATWRTRSSSTGSGSSSAGGSTSSGRWRRRSSRPACRSCSSRAWTTR